MKTLLKVAFPLALGLLVQPSATFAQPGAFNPDMLECGQQGDAEIICGTRAPEDFEVTPDGKFLIIANFGAVTDPALDLFDLASKTFGEIALTAEKREGWGVAACSDSIGAQVSPHGLSLTQRASGEWQLYVVNHNVRESVEMYELQQAGAGWALVWRGCVLADEPYNDVAALADGSFVATRPQAIMHEEQNIFAGAPTGNVALWTAAAGEQVLPGTDTGYPNGVVVSADGRYAYVSGWTTRTFHKYDLTQRKEVAKVDSTFMADNLTWTPAGKILAGGIKGVQGNCPAESENPCLQAMVVAEIDPASLAVTVVHDSAGRALINGTSVAIQAGDAIYVGSFQGDRLVKLPR
jgi:DNA-binding beta-propeller fold protein YncE